MIKWLLILVLSSCSNSKLLQNEIKKHKLHLIKEIPVSSKSEAMKYFHVQKNYLTFLFEQSRDPYFGKPKWSDECIAQNTIGEINDDGKIVSMRSELYLDFVGEPGHCPGSNVALPGYYYIIYCHNSDKVMELKFAKNTNIKTERFQLCP